MKGTAFTILAMFLIKICLIYLPFYHCPVDLDNDEKKMFPSWENFFQTTAIQSMQTPVTALTQANILVIEIAALRQALKFLVPSHIPCSHNMLTL